MVGALLNLGLVVEKGTDFGDLTLKIASKDKAFDVGAGNVPPSVNLGDWIISPSNDFEIIRQTSKIPLRSRVEDGKVQVLSYITIPLGHCSTRDGYLLPRGAKVWSPHFGFAYSEPDLLFGLKDEILYEAWLEFRAGVGESLPIWALKVVVQPLFDPTKTILLKDTPWKIRSRKEVKGDTSLSAVLKGGKPAVDSYYRGLVIAIISYPEPAVALFCWNYEGSFAFVEEKNIKKSVFNNIVVGQVVKFRDVSDPYSNVKCTHVKEILVTTRADIKFEIARYDGSCQSIKLFTSVGIDDELLNEEEEEGIITLISEYGSVTVRKGKFAKLMDGVYMCREDLEAAKNEGKELQVWISYVPVSNSWTVDRIHTEFFKSTATP